jgi:hypothetical protein
LFKVIKMNNKSIDHEGLMNYIDDLLSNYFGIL